MEAASEWSSGQRSEQIRLRQALVVSVGFCLVLGGFRLFQPQPSPEAALWLGYAGCILYAQRRLRYRQIGRSIVIVGVAALAINAARYFVLWPASPGAYREFYVADTHMGEVARALARMPDLEAAGYRVFVQIRSGTDDVVSYLIGDTGVGTYDGRSLSAPPGARALLIAKASSQIDTDERARQLLGANARRLGVGPSSPTSGRPEFVVYGDGELAARAVDLVLAQWRR